jgi:hypothetical protein
VADAVEPAWQHVKQEAADERVGCERHDALPLPAIAAVVLIAEGDTGIVEGEQPAVRDGDPVREVDPVGWTGIGVTYSVVGD